MASRHRKTRRKKAQKPAGSTYAAAGPPAPDEIAAIGLLLLMENLESAGPNGEIGFVRLNQHEVVRETPWEGAEADDDDFDAI